MNRKEQQNARRAENRCVSCGDQDERTMAGKSHCEICARAISEKGKMYRQYKISHGRCAECGNQDKRTRAGGFRCASCLSKNQQTSMRLYSRRRQENRCVRCGEQDDRTLDGKCHCAACYSAKYAKEKAVKQEKAMKKTKKQETGETMMYNDVRQIVRDRFSERLREARNRLNISQKRCPCRSCG